MTVPVTGAPDTSEVTWFRRWWKPGESRRCGTCAVGGTSVTLSCAYSPNYSDGRDGTADLRTRLRGPIWTTPARRYHDDDCGYLADPCDAGLDAAIR